MEAFAFSASLPLCYFLLFYNLMTTSILKRNINIDIILGIRKGIKSEFISLQRCCLSFQTHLTTAFYSWKTDDVVEAMNRDSG